MDRQVHGIAGTLLSERLPIVQYEIVIYDRTLADDNILFTTVISLFMGNIICTGHLMGMDTLIDFISYVIADNEGEKLKASRIIEYCEELSLLVLLERREYV